MSVAEILLIAVALAADAFVVATSVGAAWPRGDGRQTFRIAFHFGLFQGLMPLLGWLLGDLLESWVEPWDHWLAFALLAFVGGRMVRGGGEQEGHEGDPSRGATLILLSVATSLDALAIGLTLALVGGDILTPAIVIAVVAALLSFVGIQLGRRLGQTIGPHAERFGGFVLIGIGVKLLVEGLLG